jgi:hypothetical protein
VNEGQRFLNSSQPQTLYGATILLYINAFFGLLSLGFTGLFGLLFVAGLAAGGFGIANEKKWGYAVGVTVAILQVVLLLAVAGFDVLGFPTIMNFMFDALLVALLLHPMSRDYQRIWFH